MTRFNDQQCVAVDGQNISFKARPGLDAGAIAAMPQAITGAKTASTNTIAKLNAGTIGGSSPTGAHQRGHHHQLAICRT